MADPGDDAIELLAELIAIDSVNPGLVPGAAGESHVVEHLRARLSQSGFDVTLVPAPGRPERPSLLAVPTGATDGPTVILNGHLDTVGVSGMDQPFVPRVEGDRMYGRGTADMKGGVAALVTAAERLVASGAHVSPVLALVADEEDASIGSESVIDALPGLGVQPDVCLIAEPTDLRLCRTHRGFAVMSVTFTGKATHSSQPELGVNAVTHLGRFLHAVDLHAATVRERGGALMSTMVSGGESMFVVPESADCIVEMRTPPDQSAATALGEVESLLDREWQADAELVLHRDGWRIDDAGPAADLAARLGEALDTATSFDAPYWMEAPLWQRVCPTVICGPSGGGMHAADEWVDLRQVRAFTHALEAVLAD